MCQQESGYTAYSTFSENLDTKIKVKTKRCRNGRMKYFFRLLLL